jgi:hypothetical protein
MKTNCLRYLCAVVFAMLGLSASAADYDFEADGFYFKADLETMTVSLVSGDNAYKGELVIPSHVEYKGREFTVVSIGPEAFASCDSLSVLNIPSSVVNIGKAAFSGCRSLKNVVLPIGLTVLEEELFNECVELDSIVIPQGVDSIKTKAFYHCAKIKKLEIPNSVQYIGMYAFNSCSSLEELVIEDGLHELVFATWYNSSLKRLYLGRNVAKSASNGSKSVFSDCHNLSSVVIGDYVTEIPKECFSNSQLKTIIIPPSVVGIGYDAFPTKMDSVIIEDSYNELAYSTYYNCSAYYKYLYIGRDSHGLWRISNADEIVTSDFVTYIADHLAYDSLKTIVFGANIETIPDLSECEQLQSISLTSTVPPTAQSFSDKQYMDLLVNVPKGSLSAYQSADVWKNFWEMKESEELLTTIEVDGLKYYITSDDVFRTPQQPKPIRNIQS